MTDLKPEDLAKLREIAEKAQAACPSWHYVGMSDPFAIYVNTFKPELVSALLADNARKDEAIKAAAVYLDTLGDNLLRNDADMLLDECRDPKDVAAGLRQALSGANHAD